MSDVATLDIGAPDGDPIHVTFTSSEPVYHFRWWNGDSRLRVGRRRYGRVVLVTVRNRAPKGWRRHIRRQKAGE